LLTVKGNAGYTAGSHASLGNTGQYATVPDSDAWDPQTTGNLTVLAVVATDGYAGGKHRYYVVHRADATTTVPGWAFYRNKDTPHPIGLFTCDGTTSQTQTMSDTVATTTFRGRGAVITPAGSHKLWSNGAAASAAATVSGSYANASQLVIGAPYDSSVVVGHSQLTQFRGVLIYNSALTDQQMLDYAAAAGAGTT
jgi:hypothetical protein